MLQAFLSLVFHAKSKQVNKTIKLLYFAFEKISWFPKKFRDFISYFIFAPFKQQQQQQLILNF